MKQLFNNLDPAWLKFKLENKKKLWLLSYKMLNFIKFSPSSVSKCSSRLWSQELPIRPNVPSSASYRFCLKGFISKILWHNLMEKKSRSINPKITLCLEMMLWNGILAHIVCCTKIEMVRPKVFDIICVHIQTATMEIGDKFIHFLNKWNRFENCCFSKKRVLNDTKRVAQKSTFYATIP